MSFNGDRVLVLARRQSLVMRSFVMLLSRAGVAATAADEYDDTAPYDGVVSLLVCDDVGAGQVTRLRDAQRRNGHDVVVVALDGVVVADADVRLPPRSGIDDLLHALRVARRSTNGTRRGRPLPGGSGLQLTAREAEVVALLVEGMSSQRIADVLGISVHTVRSHVQNIMSKLGVSSRLEVASMTAVPHRTAGVDAVQSVS